MSRAVQAFNLSVGEQDCTGNWISRFADFGGG